MPGPRVDPNAPPPRIRPWFIALGLAVTALIGGVVIYGMASDGLARDRAVIEEYGPVALDRVDQMEKALALIADGNASASAMARIEGSAICVLSPFETLPEILEPLQAHCSEAANAIRAIHDSLQDGPGSDLEPLILAAQKGIADTRYEVDDLRCLARIECIPATPS